MLCVLLLFGDVRCLSVVVCCYVSYDVVCWLLLLSFAIVFFCVLW